MMFNCLSILACLFVANTSFACDVAQAGTYGECSINYDELNSQALKQELSAIKPSAEAMSLSMKKQKNLDTKLLKKLEPLKKGVTINDSMLKNLKGYELDNVTAGKVKTAIRDGVTKSKAPIVIENLEDYKLDGVAADRLNAAIQNELAQK